jgi:hypothetical protein
MVAYNDEPGACILMWPKPHSLKENVKLLRDACLHVSHSGLFLPAPFYIDVILNESVQLETLSSFSDSFCLD